MSFLSDPLMLSRIQFGFTMSFHILFPAFTIGLASWLVVVEALWLRTRDPLYQELYALWVKVFSVAFGMGVVSGVVMSYQFGTNWAGFAVKLGDVLGPLLTFEVLTAFFLESSFLGVMLFGWGRVSRRMHFISTCGVAVGTLISTFWILSANSWMQTPAGYQLLESGVVKPQNWWAIIFNPSFPFRLMHMVTGAYLTTAFAVGGVACYYLQQKKYIAHAKIMLSMAMAMACLVAPLQAFLGDLHGLNTLKHQPAKVAAMEGAWETERGAPLRLFGWPNVSEERTDYTIGIPKLGSLILTHSLDGEIRGLKSFAKEERPPVTVVFVCFRIMVGIGVSMIFTGFTAAYLYYRKRLFTSRLFQYWGMLMAPSGFIAILSGWFVTEVGRQPYLAYHLLRTRDALSPVPAPSILFSLASLMTVYSLIFGLGTYYILRLLYLGPRAHPQVETYGQHGLDKPSLITEMEHEEPPRD